MVKQGAVVVVVVTTFWIKDMRSNWVGYSPPSHWSSEASEMIEQIHSFSNIVWEFQHYLIWDSNSLTFSLAFSHTLFKESLGTSYTGFSPTSLCALKHLLIFVCFFVWFFFCATRVLFWGRFYPYEISIILSSWNCNCKNTKWGVMYPLNMYVMICKCQTQSMR